MNFLSDNFISEFLVTVIKWLFSFINDYSLTIILVTLAIKFIVLPLDLKQRQSTRKMGSISAEVEGIKKRYANAPDQAQKKIQELYREKKVKPTAGCLPMLITMILLFAFFGSLRVIASEQSIGLILKATQNGAQSVQLPQWLWIHNLWQPDSGFAGILPSAAEFKTFVAQNSNYITPQAMMLLKNGGLITFSGGTMDVVTKSYESLTSSIISANNLTGLSNGWFVLPVLAGVSLFFQQWIMQKQNPQQAQMQGGTGKMMLYFFPLFSVYICATSNSAFAIYWLVSNLFTMGLTFIQNAYYKNKEKNAPIVR